MISGDVQGKPKVLFENKEGMVEEYQSFEIKLIKHE